MDRASLGQAVRVVAAAAILVVALHGISAAAAPAPGGIVPHGSTDHLWGWVTARQPSTASYVPAAKDQGNSSGGTNTVERLDKGQYRVRFNGLDASLSAGQGRLGHVQATAMSGLQRLCTPVELSSGNPVTVYVYCRNRNGGFADSAFSVNFLARRDAPHGPLAYLFADQPTTPFYDPPADYAFNSAEGDHGLQRLGTGYYHVFLTNQYAGLMGNLQVTGDDSVCRLAERDHNSDPGDIYASLYIRCRDLDRDPADSRFWLSFTDGAGLKADPDARAAYLWANKPTRASYQPAEAFRYSSAGIAPTVTRSGVGTYVVRLPGLPLGGSAQVTAYGPGKSECQLSGIRTSGRPQRIGVLCFKPNGDRVDSRFSLTFTR